MKLKAKGLKNEEKGSLIRGSLSPDYEYALCASDNDSVYVWSNIETSVVESSKKGLLSKVFTSKKLDEVECF